MKHIITYSIIGWIIIGLIFVLVMNTITDPMTSIARVSSVIVFQMAFYFWNLLYLTPNLLEKGHIRKFVLSIVVSVVSYSVIMGYADLMLDGVIPVHPIKDRPFIIAFGFRLLTCVPALVISTLIVKSILLSKKNEESLELKNRMLEAETDALKAQINPHFLFNTLNNIYSLSQIKSEKTGTAIMNLSEILRYVTYESNQKFVPLDEEIKQIKNFLELQYLKDDEHENIKVNIDKGDSVHQIAPLLLIPFIENSFKHGNPENKADGWIRIDIHLNGDSLQMLCSNSVECYNQPKDTTGGVGLENVKKRLHLLYPDKHKLIIEKLDKEYSVNLKIDLSS